MNFCDVWLFNIDTSHTAVQSRIALLSDDERERARRFHYDIHRHRYIFTRATLRMILSSYIQAEAAQIRFVYGPWHKPAIADEMNSDLQFNLSHSGSIGAVGLTNAIAIGIDVERIDRSIADDTLAATAFSPYERTTLEALSPDMRIAAFYRGWTCKEAYLKGRGDGLSVPLMDFDVELDPTKPPAIVRPYDGDDRWTIHVPDVLETHALAVAIHGIRPSPRVRWWGGMQGG